MTNIACRLITAAAVTLLLASEPDIAHARIPADGGDGFQTRTSASITRYHTVEIDGVKVFYREAGPSNAPVLLLLHGFPASSFMYRDLMERLSDRFHLVAPDYPGFGYSDAPSAQVFSYTFEHLADAMEKFTQRLGLDEYGLYMQDFGGPVGFRLATRHPEKISFLIVQNANAYVEGLPDSFWKLARTLWRDPSPANYQKMREAAMSDAALEWNYTHGVKEPQRISPDSWMLQRALLSRPGNKEAMLALLYDYRSNPPLYPVWQSYFRQYHPPMLIAWGERDVIFPAPGAKAYLRDLPGAELHLLDTGHFALEDHAEEIAALTCAFFDRYVARR